MISLHVPLQEFEMSTGNFLEFRGSLDHTATGITSMVFCKLSLTALSQDTQLSFVQKTHHLCPFHLAQSTISFPPNVEENIPPPKAKHRVEWLVIKVMQQISGRIKTRAPTFELSPYCGLNLVPDMPFPIINHHLSHTRLFLFFPCRWPYIFTHDRALPSTVWYLWNTLQVK